MNVTDAHGVWGAAKHEAAVAFAVAVDNPHSHGTPEQEAPHQGSALAVHCC